MISYGLILLALTFLLLLIGSITDIKWRIVPDWISYTAIVAGIVVRLIESIATLTIFPILEGIVGFGIFFILACIAFYTKLWGGGDSKVLMGLGALLGIWWVPNHIMVSMMINFLIVGGAYGLAYFIFLGLKHFSDVKQATGLLLTNKAVSTLHIIVYIMFGGFLVAGYFSGALLPMLGVCFLLIFYLFVLSKAIEQTCFVKMQPVGLLEEGDWVVDPVKIKGKVIAGPKDTGITMDQIKRIQKSKIKSIKIKEGIPFIPNFFLTFLATVFIGNLAYVIMGLV